MNINKLPPELKAEIFSFLPPKELPNCFKVCTTWNNINTMDKHLWKLIVQNNCSQNVLDDFGPFIKEKKITWKNTYRFSYLSKIFKEIIENIYFDSLFRMFRNTKALSWCGYNSPKIFVKHGNFLFSIYNSKDIKIREKGKEGSKFIKGEKGTEIVYLAAKKNFLFAFLDNFMIYQYDIKTLKFIKKIETCVPSLNDKEKNKLFNSEYKEYHKISNIGVQDNYIILQYSIPHDENYLDDNEKDYLKPFLNFEIINYLNPKKRKILKILNIGEEGMLTSIIQDGKLYIVCSNKIHHFSLKTFKKFDDIKFNKSLGGSHIKPYKKEIYFYNKEEDSAYKINIKNHKLTKISKKNYPIFSVENIYFDFFNDDIMNDLMETDYTDIKEKGSGKKLKKVKLLNNTLNDMKKKDISLNIKKQIDNFKKENPKEDLSNNIEFISLKEIEENIDQIPNISIAVILNNMIKINKKAFETILDILKNNIKK